MEAKDTATEIIKKRAEGGHKIPMERLSKFFNDEIWGRIIS